MNSTLEYATTPLALASLIAILLVGVIKLLVAGKNNALNRLITHYGFALVLTFGVLGNAAYLYESYQSSETLIIGTVVDKDGNYLPRVTIDTGGHARGMTSDFGDFVLAIPKSRVQPEYSISASLNGYKREVKVVENKARMFLRFELDRKPVDLSRAISIGDHRVIIGHFMGLPEIGMAIKFTNDTTQPLRFENVGMTVTSPFGETRRLIPISTNIGRSGPQMPVLTDVSVESSQSLEYYYRFLQFDGEVQQLAVSAQSALQSNTQFQQSGPQVGQSYLNPELVSEIVAAVNEKWFWGQGVYTITLSASIDGVPAVLQRTVSLTDSAIGLMKNSADYYADGYGIFPNISLLPVGTAQPGHEVPSSLPQPQAQ